MYVPDYHGFKSNDIYWSIIASDEFVFESDNRHPDVFGGISNVREISTIKERPCSKRMAASEITERLLGSARFAAR